jgi:hypothetical protein
MSSATLTGVGLDTMNVSPRARGLVSESATAELKFSIDNIDRRAVTSPNGSGMGSRAIL